MFFSKENLKKNYSIIIVPEKGSRTKTFELSTKNFTVFLVVLITGLIATFICVAISIMHFTSQNQNTSEFYKKEQYIHSLEQINKTNIEKIKKYNKSQDNIKNKLNEIQQLEEQIKSKIKKSVSLKSQSFVNSRHKDLVKYNGNLVKEMESKIVKLNELNKEVSTILAVEEFIPSELPCAGNITSYFGYRKNPFHKSQADTHDGIDIGCAYGTKIYASASGTVEYASSAIGYGNEVSIDHHNGLETIYGHNSKILVHVGQTVNKGDLIALSGSTGSSTGPHLHFEIRKNRKAIDPIKFYKKGEGKSGI